MIRSKERHLWAFLAALACVMWGISGLFAKALFNVSPAITPLWLTQVRMVVAGAVLLIVAGLRGKRPLKSLAGRKNAWMTFAYGMLGLLPVQLFYFIVVQEANASIATILQFIGPFIVMGYLAATRKQVMRGIDILAALAAFIGVFLLATHGNVSHLALTPSVLFWGLLSAVGSAINTLLPVNLLKRVPSMVVTGWGLSSAGIALVILHPSWPHIPNTPWVWICVLAVIIIGTVIPFQLLVNSLRYIKPTTASLLDAFEPLSATVGSVICFNLVMLPPDWFGSVLVVAAAMALNIVPQKKIRGIKKNKNK